MLYTLNEFVNTFVQYGASWDSILFVLIYGGIALLCIPCIIKRQSIISPIVFLCFATAFFFAIALGLNGGADAKKNFVPFFLYVFPFLLLGQAILDYKDLEKKIISACWYIVIAVSFWTINTVFFSQSGVYVAYMNMAYCFLPFSVLTTYLLFVQFNFWRLLFFLVTLSNQILWGTRGPIVLLLIFISICILLSPHVKALFKVVFFSFCVICLIVLPALFYGVSESIDSQLSDLGIINSGIKKLMYEDLSDGRNDLNSSIFALLKDNILFGEGVYSDRYALDTYAHNIFLEFCLDFGIPIALFLFIGFFLRVIYCFRSIQFSDFRFYLLSVSIIMGIGKLLFSSSYLEEPYFFFMIGLVFNKSLYNINFNSNSNHFESLSAHEESCQTSLLQDKVLE